MEGNEVIRGINPSSLLIRYPETLLIRYPEILLMDTTMLVVHIQEDY